MGLLHDAAKKTGQALGSVRAGAEKIAIRKVGADHLAMLDVSSPAFAAGEPLPISATKEGAGTPPPLRWSNAPAATRSFVVVVEDPDAPFGEPFVHWIVYGIPATVSSLEGGTRTIGREGQNSTMSTGFTPAAPPPGHGTHHYHFQVFALDIDLDLAAGAGRRELFNAMRGHVLACGDVVGTYARD